VLFIRKMRLHTGPLALSTALVLLGGLWQFVIEPSRLDEGVLASEGGKVSGSTLAGLVIGSLAAGIIFFEMLLWPRKRLRKYKLGRTKYWLAYHLWLGLACGPLAFIHSGFRFGGTFTTVLMVLLLLVLGSGVFGWLMQVIIPRWMLGSLPQETIPSQIDDVSLLSALENRQMLTVVLGTKPDQAGKMVGLEKHLETLKRGGSFVDGFSGKQIVVGAVQRRDPQRTAMGQEGFGECSPADRMVIWKQYVEVIEPFLLRGFAGLDGSVGFDRVGAKLSPLRTVQRAQGWFSSLREACSQEAIPVVERLQGTVMQRLQFDAQRMAHAWLHRWVAFHAGISVLLTVLLVVHIIESLRYI
jgi:hypothetical protein